MQALIDAQEGGFKLEPWDWEFYSEQVRKAKYDLDERDQALLRAGQRARRTACSTPRTNSTASHSRSARTCPSTSPTYASSRSSTRTGSRWRSCTATTSSATTRTAAPGWTARRPGEAAGPKPVVFNVANFDKPAPGQPALLTFDDVTTMFHEFGHGLHGMFADTEVSELSGTQVAARLRGVPIAVQ